MQDFDILTEITQIEVIARGHGVDVRHYLNSTYGWGHWRKLKGIALIRLHKSGRIHLAELHWFEAHGIGRYDFKRKRLLDKGR